MVIPQVEPWAAVDPDKAWSALSAEAKHERILCAAGRVFSSEGLDAPMPAVAAQAGAGVASVYRQFPSKRDLLAALVTRRLEQIRLAAATAGADADADADTGADADADADAYTGADTDADADTDTDTAAASQTAARPDAWTALTGVLRTIVEGQSADDFLGDAFRIVRDHPDVELAFAATRARLEVLVAAARDQGRLRADATVDDLWLVFAATRSARGVEPDSFVRMLELLIAGLERRG